LSSTHLFNSLLSCVFQSKKKSNGPIKGQNAWQEKGEAQKHLPRATEEAQGGVPQKENK
jgi:hypothetical protein